MFSLEENKENELRVANYTAKNPSALAGGPFGQTQDRDLIDSFLESDLDNVLAEFSE